MAKVLVTGGAGFIGSHLVDKLIEKGHKTFVLDNLSTGKKENLNPQAEFKEADICDFEAIKPFFNGVDFVFHLAAIPRVLISVEDPVKTSKVNILGTVNVFKAAIEAKVKKIIFASSSSVYGEQEKLPLKEDMAPNPISPYGLQKIVVEQFAKLFTQLYGLPIISLRYFNVYGPRIDFESGYSLVLGRFLQQKNQGQPLTIYGTGEQTRGFCYVSDVAEGTIKAIENEDLNGGEIINIGSEKSHSVNYLAKLIGGEIRSFPPRPGDPLHTMADISKARILLGWQPQVSFEEGVKRTQEWFQNQITQTPRV